MLSLRLQKYKYFLIMQKLADIITKIIDFFYRPFQKILPQQIFRYAACGGSNMLLDWLLYFLIYNFAVNGRYFDLGFVVISPHIFTLCIVFPLTTLTGFWLNKNITFTQSSLQTYQQFLRYISIVALNLAINYFGIKLLVETVAVYAPLAKVLVTLITIIISFLAQKFYTFRR